MTEITDSEAAEVLWASSEEGRAAVRAAHRKFLELHPGNLDVPVADLAAVVYAAIRAAKPPGDVRDAVARSHEAHRAAGLRAGDPGTWQELLPDLLELDDAGALAGIRAVAAERVRQVRAGEPDGFAPRLDKYTVEIRPGQQDVAALAVPAALLAAEIDRRAAGQE